MADDIRIRRHREVVALLLQEGLITQEKLAHAREEAKRTGLNIERAMEKLGFITHEAIAEARARALGIPYIDLTDYVFDTGLLALIPEHVAKKCQAAPLFKIGETLTVGMVNPNDVVSVDYIRRVAQVDMIETVMVSERGLQKVLDSYGEVAKSIDDIVKIIDKGDSHIADGGTEAAEEAPIIKLVNLIISQAAKDRASDIHVEPEEDRVRVRCRIDGLLQEVTTVPKKLQEAIVSRIKVLANMDIAESRKPQDGRIRLQAENKDLDIRVSTFPTVHGENVVMRLLDKASVLRGLADIGLSDRDREIFGELIRRPNGIILVTGPTGSGKTSTLYAALTTISSMEKNIVTIEDPVEYEFPLIRQTQVNPVAGISFANGLRSLLRQDPDIVMVGEIRDQETSEIAVRAALTGHLVFSTLHTNDAPSALTRLLDMGVEPFLISSSVIGIVAQRLVRLICDKCREAYHLSEDMLRKIGMPAGTLFYRGKGCPRCKGVGFMGRTGIFEVVVLNDPLRSLIETKASADEIRKTAVAAGMKTLREDGLRRASQGITTLEEVLRVTQTE